MRAVGSSWFPTLGADTADVVVRGPRRWLDEAAFQSDAAIVLVIAVALAVALRFALIGHQGYWLDEGITISVLRKSFWFWQMLHALPYRESTPPLYYCLAWVWARTFGWGEAGLRSLSALFGVLTVPVVYAVGARMISSRVGLVAASLTASSPLLVWYSQEARPYSLLALLCALSLLMFELARVRATWRRLIGWAVVSALAMLAHYFAAMVVVPEAGWLLAAHRRRWAAWAAVALVGAVGVPLIPLARSQRQFARWISGAPLTVRLRQLRMQFLLGFATPDLILWLMALAVVVLAAVLIIRRGDSRELRGGLGMAALAVVGFGLSVAVAVAGSDLINTRNLLELWLPLAIFVAAGLGARRAGLTGLAGAATLCAIGVAGTVSIDANPSLQRADWRPITAAIGPPPMGGARAVLLLRYGSPYPVTLYRPRLHDMSAHRVAQVSELDVIAVDSAPRDQHCWWGAACALSVTRLARPPSLVGFKLVEEVHTGRFVLMRLRARSAEHETAATILASVPPSARHPHRVLIEPAAR
jgi:hypothetical protein